MSISTQSRLYISWLILTVITLIAWWVGGQHGEAQIQPNAAVGLTAMAITLVKVRVIIREFMEVRRAPRKLKLVTDSWLVMFIVAMIIAYFLAG